MRYLLVSTTDKSKKCIDVPDDMINTDAKDERNKVAKVNKKNQASKPLVQQKRYINNNKKNTKKRKLN